MSEDGTTIRTPKPLISKEFQMMVQQKTAIIEEAKREREKHYARPQIVQQTSKSQIDSSNIRESSLERSSDSQKLVASSNIDKSSYEMSKRSSESETSEEARKREAEKKKKRPKKEKLTEDELSAFVPIRLSETNTETLLYIPSLIVSNDNMTLHQEAEQRNAQYEKLLQIKTGSDNFSNHSAQTFNFPSKDKAQLTRICEDNLEENEVGCQAMNFEIIDEIGKETLTAYEQLQIELKKQIDKEFKEKLKNPCLLPVDLISIQQNAQVQYKERVDKGSNPDSDTSNMQSNLRGNTTQFSRNQKTAIKEPRDDESNMSSDQLSAQRTGS